MDTIAPASWPIPTLTAAAAHRQTWAAWAERQAQQIQHPSQSSLTLMSAVPMFDAREQARLTFLRWLYERDRLIA